MSQCELIVEVKGRVEQVEEEFTPIIAPVFTRKLAVTKDVGKILCATTDFLWEEEYDATKENSVSRSVPCADLIESLQLRQLESDGFYYDAEGTIAAFDLKLMKSDAGVVIRKDLLDKYLLLSGLKLVWLSRLQKEIHDIDYTISKESEWEAVLVYEGDVISGKFTRM